MSKHFNVWSWDSIYEPEPSPPVAAPKPPRMFTVPQEITPVATFNATMRFLIGQFPSGLYYRRAAVGGWPGIIISPTCANRRSPVLSSPYLYSNDISLKYRRGAK